MKTIPVGTRLDHDLHESFLAEMARRNQTKSELLLTFVRDGLARYDSTSAQVLEAQVTCLKEIKKTQEMIGAVLHLAVEESVIAIRQLPDESPDAYKERLRNAYRDLVYKAIEKGARIAASPTMKMSNAKVSHDR
ncbi:hypothetical protein [Massilia sp.]|uniref:hypothetical protein n=1 Tax=Massilia sp. TaxID=1882437 RepID=UPI00352EC1EC